MNRRLPIVVLTIALVLGGCVGISGPAAAPGQSPADNGFALDAVRGGGAVIVRTAAPPVGVAPRTPQSADGHASTGAETEHCCERGARDGGNAIDEFAHLNVTITGLRFDRAGGYAGWVTFVNVTETVDLARLDGRQATLIDASRLPNGTYTRVELVVADAVGTLESGQRVDVMVPDGRLILRKRFVVGAGSSVDFVFDVTVVEAGRSGRYVLKPVVSESDSDVTIVEIKRAIRQGTWADAHARGAGALEAGVGRASAERVGGGEAGEGRAGTGRAGAGGERTTGDVTIALVGGIEPGGMLVVRVTRNGRPVAGVPVEINNRAFETGPGGVVRYDIPRDATGIEVVVEHGGERVKLERAFDEPTDRDTGGRRARDDAGGERRATENGKNAETENDRSGDGDESGRPPFGPPGHDGW